MGWMMMITSLCVALSTATYRHRQPQKSGSCFVTSSAWKFIRSDDGDSWHTQCCTAHSTLLARNQQIVIMQSQRLQMPVEWTNGCGSNAAITYSSTMWKNKQDYRLVRAERAHPNLAARIRIIVNLYQLRESASGCAIASLHNHCRLRRRQEHLYFFY